MQLPGFIQTIVDILSPIANAIGSSGMYIFGAITFIVGVGLLLLEAFGRTPKFAKEFLVKFRQRPTAKFLALTAILAAIRNVLTFILPIPIIPGIVTWGHILAGAFSGGVGAVFGLAGVWGYGVLGTVMSDILVGTLNIATIGGIVGQTMPTYFFYKFLREPKTHNWKWVLKVIGVSFLAEGVLHAFQLPFVYDTVNIMTPEVAWGFAWPLFYIVSMPQVIIGGILLTPVLANIARRFKLMWSDLGYKELSNEEAKSK